MLLPTEHVQWLTDLDRAINEVLKERRANLPKGRKHVFINWCRRMEALIYNAEGEEFYGLNPIIQDEADFNLVKNRLDELRVTLTKPDAPLFAPPNSGQARPDRPQSHQAARNGTDPATPLLPKYEAAGIRKALLDQHQARKRYKEAKKQRENSGSGWRDEYTNGITQELSQRQRFTYEM